MMTNKVRAEKYVLRSDPSKKVQRLDAATFRDDTGTAVEEKDVASQPCEFTAKFVELCGNIEFTEEVAGLMRDVSAMPLANNATSVKVGVVRYNMHFGGDLRIPFSLLSANVSGSTDQAKVNSLKLLDPEQGNLNLKWTYAGRYHLGQFCKFRRTGDNPDRGICTAGLSVGFRYLGLDKSTGAAAPATENAYGGYIEFANTFMFPVFEVGTEEKDAGQLAIKMSASRFRQNVDESTVLFPDAVDATGKPVKVDKSYGGYGLTAQLTVTDKLGIQASHFKMRAGSSPISNVTTLSLSYSLD